ncbi:ankyrin unc44 [Lentinula edodes]|uniref:Ankyrin unc44 n=1 Tax=Lentinula edodes TaxID=5353 RepID=A0A1Q3EKH2_LENED|nr:ankyrin unc44 [Lentinula edodes]
MNNLRPYAHLGTIEESGLSDTQLNGHEEDAEEDRFVYDGESRSVSQSPSHREEEEEEEFVYPGLNAEDTTPLSPQESPKPLTPPTISELSSRPRSDPLSESPPDLVLQAQPQEQAPQPLRTHPTPAQLESSYAASSSGDLSLLQKIFVTAHETGGISAFSLANDASTRTGLTALHAAASRGYEDVVRWLIESCGAMSDLEDKEGETALHKAALNGHLHIVKYLLPSKHAANSSDALSRASVHAQDADGWTALHNACSKGYLDIVRYLCEEGGATESVDDDDSDQPPANGVNIRSKAGYTPLMNASSKGHLPVVRYLLSKQHADPLVRNNWGETAYDVAAAVFEVWICEVLERAEREWWYNRNSAHSNPNSPSKIPYNSLAIHTTIPLVLYENQRLDARLKTLATSGGKPRFSASGLGRRGRRAPFELRILSVDDDNKRQNEGNEDNTVNNNIYQRNTTIPAWRSTVQLPLLDSPYSLPRPGSHHSQSQGPTGPDRSQEEKSHFWLSDWTLDVTHPGVDADQGWQYARTFEDPEEEWTPEVTGALGRVLGGGLGGLSGVLRTPPGLGRSSSNSDSRSGSGSNSTSATPTPTTYVRRRRWVRVMRRRLDIPPLPFLFPDGKMYLVREDGGLVRYIHHPNVSDEDASHPRSPAYWDPNASPDEVAYSYGEEGHQEGQELSTIPSMSSKAQDYVSRARYLVGSQTCGLDSDGIQNGDNAGGSLSAVDARRTIAKLERATMELRLGVSGDTDIERKTQAQVLLHTYTRELERQKASAEVQGWVLTTPGAGEGIHDGDEYDYEEDDDDDDESFHYPMSPTNASGSTSIRPSSRSSSSNRPEPGRSSSINSATNSTISDLTHHLSQAPEFRVPTHEAPRSQTVSRAGSGWGSGTARSTTWVIPSPQYVHQWEKDDDTNGFFFFALSSRRGSAASLSSMICCRNTFFEPIELFWVSRLLEYLLFLLSTTILILLAPRLSNLLRRRGIAGMERVFVNQERLSIPDPRNSTAMRRQTSSQLSDLAECPVCNRILEHVGTAAEQEAHVKSCLEGGSGATQQAAKYLVYRLPAESTLIGVECVICLEEFTKGSMVARLSCFCSFHNACLSSWLQRGKACPVHAR